MAGLKGSSVMERKDLKKLKIQRKKYINIYFFKKFNFFVKKKKQKYFPNKNIHARGQ